MKPTVFIHTSCHEILAARVAMYSHLRISKNTDKFDIKLIELEDYPFMLKYHGSKFIRNKREAGWYKDVPQSFLPLRFLVPQLMGYEGRAVLTDPDIFAVSDIYELLTRPMNDKAILSSPLNNNLKGYNSSVMLLDCQKLKHWQWEKHIAQMFDKKRDLQTWLTLETEPEATIGSLEEEWNHYDTLNENTKLLHNTKQRTQPWKTGMPYIEQNLDNRVKRDKNKNWFEKLRPFLNQNARKLVRATSNLVLYGEPAVYLKHSDRRQVELFFALLKEALDDNYISPSLIEAEIRLGHIRPDIFKVLKSTNKSVEEVLDSVRQKSRETIAV